MSLHVLAVELGRARFKIELDDTDDFQSWVHKMLVDGFVYERDTSIAIADIMRHGDIFVDVGAYAGWFSLIAASIVGASGHVLAFEPNSDNYETLCRNIVLNQFEDRVTAVNAAVGRTVGSDMFWVNQKHSGVGCLWDFSKHPWGISDKSLHHTIMVPITTLDVELDKLIALGHTSTVRCIKIDVEGAEVDVLRGTEKWLSSGEIPYIFAEMNHFGMEQMGYTCDDLTMMAKRYGYNIYLMGDAIELLTQNFVYNILLSNLDLEAIEGEVTDESIHVKEAPRWEGESDQSVRCQSASHHTC